MQKSPGSQAADQYLVQRIQGASPEQLAAMLLEGGQRFINLALQAMEHHDLINQAQYVNRTSDIIFGLKERLNFDDGGEVVENLVRIYDWWMNEIFDGAQSNQPERLQFIFNQMGEMKETWEELHRRKAAGGPPPKPLGSFDELSV
jgi:flagellar secretion chaperone FliS